MVKKIIFIIVLALAFIILGLLAARVSADTVYRCRGSDYIGEPRIGSDEASKNNVSVRKEGDCAILSSADNSFAVVYYALRAERTNWWKIIVNYECSGKNGEASITAVYADSQKEDKSPSFRLDPIEKKAVWIPDTKTNAFVRGGGTIQLAVSVSDGQEIKIKSLEIQYLDTEPQAQYITCNRMSLPYGYTSWSWFYHGPVYYSFSCSSSSYNNGSYSYSYSVYKSWGSSDGYSSWSSNYSSSYSSFQEYSYSYSYTNNTVSYIPVESNYCRIVRPRAAERNRSFFNQKEQGDFKKVGYGRHTKQVVGQREGKNVQNEISGARLSSQNQQTERPGWMNKQKPERQERQRIDSGSSGGDSQSVSHERQASVNLEPDQHQKRLPQQREAQKQQQVEVQKVAPQIVPSQSPDENKDKDKDKNNNSGDSGQRKRVRSR